MTDLSAYRERFPEVGECLAGSVYGGNDDQVYFGEEPLVLAALALLAEALEEAEATITLRDKAVEVLHSEWQGAEERATFEKQRTEAAEAELAALKEYADDGDERLRAAEAELAELKARRCETCGFYPQCSYRSAYERCWNLGPPIREWACNCYERRES